MQRERNSRRRVLRALSAALFVVVCVLAGLSLAAEHASAPSAEHSPFPVDTAALASDSIPSATTTPGDLAFDSPTALGDPFGDPSGPYYHRVCLAESRDGLRFTPTGQVVADHASVPDAVCMPDGTLLVYAVDGAKRSRCGVLVLRSRDGGRTWERGSLQMKARGRVSIDADPQAVRLENGTVRLFYIVFPHRRRPRGAPGPRFYPGEKLRVRSAVSDDGVHFVEEEGVRYETSDFLTDPDVVRIGARWFMYLTDGFRSVVLSSADGRAFSRVGAALSHGAVSKTVEIGGGRYRQFFCSRGIGSAVTTDGLRFAREPGLRLAASQGEMVCDPSPVRLGDRWLLFYKVEKVPSPPPSGRLPLRERAPLAPASPPDEAPGCCPTGGG